MVDNEFRNTWAVVEFRWYTEVVTRFDASYVAGPMPIKATYDAKIKIRFNEKDTKIFYSKEDSIGHIRKLMIECPDECRKEIEGAINYLICAINGGKP